MKSTGLQINSDNCSAIGLLVLNYMEKHKLDLTAMAARVGITVLALKFTCHQNGSPGTRIISKLAKILDKSERELRCLDEDNKLKQSYQESKSSFF